MILTKNKSRILHTAIGFVCAVSITFSGITVFASPSSTELEEKTDALKGEIDTINDELSSLSNQLEGTASQIKAKSEEIEKSQLDLAAALVNESAQYGAMKERIKFIYEGGNTSLLQILFSSEDMGDFLNNAEYVSLITDYDREMLDEFKDIRQGIEEKQTLLETQKKDLAHLEDTLNSQKKALKSRLADASGELEDYQEQLLQIKALEEAENEIDSSSIVIPENADTIALMAAILECEAGATYDGMIAVGTVIMNRIASPRFPGNLKDVVYQPGQFAPAASGKLSSVLKRGPSSSAYSAAKEVLNGKRHEKVKKCLFFHASYTGKKGIHVGGNVFW